MAMLNTSPDAVLLTSTAQAWASVEACLPHFLKVYKEPHWNVATRGGLCVHAAAWLYTLLRESGRQPVLAFVQGNILGHCFVLCDGFRLDPTIQQFGEANAAEIVWYEPEQAAWFHREPILFSDIVSLHAYLQTLGWHEAQLPWYFVESGES